MTNKQKLLALEAALTACGTLIPPQAKQSVKKVMEEMFQQYDELPFGVFMDDQSEACLALAIWTSTGG